MKYKDLIEIAYYFIVGFFLWIFKLGEVNGGNNPRYKKACIKENRKHWLGSQHNPRE